MSDLLAPGGTFEVGPAEQDPARRGQAQPGIPRSGRHRRATAACSPPRASRPRRLGLPLHAAFIRDTLAQATPALAISAPVLNPATSERAIYFARAVTLGPDRRVLAVAEVPVSIITTILAQSVQIPGLVVTLERDDGQLLASVPASNSQLGERLAAPLPARALDGVPIQAPGRLDGAPSILSVRPLLYRSLRISAGIPHDTALADWRQDRNLIATVTAIFIAMILAAGAATHWQIGRLAHARLELARAKDNMDRALASMADGFLLCDADDRVVAWNDALPRDVPVAAHA